MKKKEKDKENLERKRKKKKNEKGVERERREKIERCQVFFPRNNFFFAKDGSAAITKILTLRSEK